MGSKCRKDHAMGGHPLSTALVKIDVSAMSGWAAHPSRSVQGQGSLVSLATHGATWE